MLLISGCTKTQLIDTYCYNYHPVPLKHTEIDYLSDYAKIALDHNSETYKKLCVKK